MSWLEIICIIAVLAGLFAGAALVAQRPTFWIGMGTAIFRGVAPMIVAYVTKRMPPEQEKAWRDCQKRGGKWNYRTKRCE